MNEENKNSLAQDEGVAPKQPEQVVNSQGASEQRPLEKKTTVFVPKDWEFASVTPQNNTTVNTVNTTPVGQNSWILEFEEGLPPPPESVLMKMDSRAIVKKGKEYVYVNKDGSFTKLRIPERAYVLCFPKNKKKKPVYKRVDYHYYIHINSEELEDIEISYRNKQIAAEYAWAVFKQKNQKDYDIDRALLRDRYMFDIVFLKKDWKEKKLKNVMGTMATAEKYALGLLAYYGYESLESVTAVNFEKDFWESLFIPASRKKIMSPKDLFMFTRKLGKKYRTNPEGGDKMHMKEMIHEFNAGASRNTAIQLLAYMEDYNLPLHAVIGRIPENFNPIYQSVVKIGQLNGKVSEAFLNLAEITERQYELSRAITKSLRMPIITFLVVLAVGVIAVYTTVPIIEDVYNTFGATVPTGTIILKGIVYGLVQYWYIIAIVAILMAAAYNFWSKYTLYGKKFMHDLSITMPMIGEFIKRRDYEVLTSIGALIYTQGEDLAIILHKLKRTVSNFHISGVLNTAAWNWEDNKIYPGVTMGKYPQYIDPKISNAWKGATSPVTEFTTLSGIYKGENDDFIESLQKILEPLLMVFIIAFLGFIIMSVVIPLYNIANVIN